MSKDESQKLMVKLAEQKLKNSYQFNETFDGTAGENALKFRREMYDYFQSLDLKLGKFFDGQLALQNIKGAFVGTGKQHIKRDEAKKANDFYTFMNWFDKTYDLTGLRKSLYNELKNWNIKKDTADLSIVEIYQTRVDLFNATETVSTDDVVNSTKLDESTMIDAILNAIRKDRKKLWEIIQINIFTNGSKPSSLIELKALIKHAHDAKMSLNTGNNDDDKDPTIVNNTVNAISMRQFPALVNSNKFKNKQPNYNKNKNKFNNQNTKFNNTKRKIYKNKYDIPGHLQNYCNKCGKYGHFASDCVRIHSNRHNKLVDYYMSLRPDGTPATKPLTNQINVTQTIDDIENEIEEIIIEPTNDLNEINDEFTDEFQM